MRNNKELQDKLNISINQLEAFHKQKFDSVYNKWRKTLEQDLNFELSHSNNFGFASRSEYSYKPAQQIKENELDDFSEKDILENDTLFITPQYSVSFYKHIGSQTVLF